MSYDIKSLRKELTSKRLADDGLVAVGQIVRGGGFLGSLIAETTTKKYTISKMGTKIAIIPYNYHNIEYNSGIGFDVRVIKKAKVTGDGLFIVSKLKIWTIDNRVHTYFISEGRRAVKEILRKLKVPSEEKKA